MITTDTITFIFMILINYKTLNRLVHSFRVSSINWWIIDRLIDIFDDKLIKRLIGRLIYILIGRVMYRFIGRLINRLIGRLMYRFISRFLYRYLEKLLIDWLVKGYWIVLIKINNENFDKKIEEKNIKMHLLSHNKKGCSLGRIPF